MKKIVLIGLVILMSLGLGGCTEISKDEILGTVENELKNSFEIEEVSVRKAHCPCPGYEFKLKADGTEFYASGSKDCNAAGGLGSDNNIITASLVYSLYRKYQSQIESLASKYNLLIEYKEKEPTDGDVNDDFYSQLVVNGTNNQLTEIHNFAQEVVNIPEINKVFNLIYPEENGIRKEDYSSVLYDQSVIEVAMNDDEEYFGIMEEVANNETSQLLN